ncbi:hypothetical protein Pelo_11835 [Pelomyxa schiedti]|nr:hypothetical protein Pelo_11835 [Pelomyxa schiedti]
MPGGGVHKPFKLKRKGYEASTWTAWELGGSDEDWDPFYPCFFFSDSVFMLVFDGSGANIHLPLPKLHFWLHQIVECHNSKRTSFRSGPPKVLIVGCYLTGDSFCAALKGFLSPLISHWESRITFCGCLAIDLGNPGWGYTYDDKRYAEGKEASNIIRCISDALESSTSRAPYFVPPSWVKLQGVLTSMAKTHPFIPRWSQLIRVAGECGVGRTTGKQSQHNEQEEMVMCFDWLLATGIDNEIVVLNPSWFTESRSAMKATVLRDLTGSMFLTCEGQMATWLDTLGRPHTSSVFSPCPPDIDSFWNMNKIRAIHACVLPFGFLPAEEFASILCSLCVAPNSTPTMIWKDGLVMSKYEKTEVFHLLMNRVVDKATGYTKVEITMKTSCPEGTTKQINWKNNPMTSAIYLLRRTARSMTGNPSLDPLFVCPKCWFYIDFGPDWGSRFGSPLGEGPHSFTSHKEIINAVTEHKATTVSCCRNHKHVEFSDVVPEDFFNPPPPPISSTTNADEKHFPALYCKYSNFDDSEPDREAVNYLFTPESTTLRHIPDHNNVAKFFGLALHNGTSLLGYPESIPPDCQTTHLLPSTLSTHRVVSLAELLKVLCIDHSSSAGNFQQGGALEEVLPMYLREKILFDVAHGLEHLHSQYPPIVHGDVHIGNVLITSLDPNGSGPLAKITYGRLPHCESGTVETPESILRKSTLFSTHGDVWNFGILVHNVVAPQSSVALKSAPAGNKKNFALPLNIAAATNPGSKLKWIDRLDVCRALASGEFVLDIAHCTTTSPAAPKKSTPSSLSSVAKNRIRKAAATVPSYPLPFWARQVLSWCLVADPLDRPSMTGINHAWGYIKFTNS